MPYIQLAMERSRKDWMKTAGKQRFRGTKASPYAYLKFSPMNYISIFIFILCFIHLLIINTHNHLNPPDWDLQDDHSLLQADNLRGIDPYSRKVYYLDDPVHLLVSCARLWRKCWVINAHTKLNAIIRDHNFAYHVFGAIAGDCSSLDNWRFILLLRLGNFLLILLFVYLIQSISFTSF